MSWLHFSLPLDPNTKRRQILVCYFLLIMKNILRFVSVIKIFFAFSFGVLILSQRPFYMNVFYPILIVCLLLRHRNIRIAIRYYNSQEYYRYDSFYCHLNILCKSFMNSVRKNVIVVSHVARSMIEMYGEL